MSLIIISVTTFCLETLRFFEDKSSLQFQFLHYLESVCVVWFTLEFFSRLIFCGDKVAFFKSAMNWIDFCAIFPFYLELMLRKNNMKTIVVLRVVRITRLFRIFKLSRHSYGLQILGHTLKSSCRELFLLVFFLSIAVIIFSSLIYYAEKDYQADKFDSIPGSFWWSVVTMTTIGYGDIVPKTAPGKCVGILCALCGVLVIALPIPVIVNNFSLYYAHAQAKLRASNKRKKPLLFGAANALRMADPWMPNRLLQKQRSEQSDITAILHSPRRTPLASPTHTRHSGAINTTLAKARENGTRQGFTRSSPCPSINSSLNSRTSAKSPPSSRMLSNSPGDDNQVSKHSSPVRGAPSQLPVIRLSPNYESPSINVSPPSTPSKTNSQIQSSVGSPYPLSPYADSSTYSQDLYTTKSSTCASRQELSPLHSPLFLSSSCKSTLSTGISDFMTTPSTPCSFSSCSSKLASPRGRMGRRNGICILGNQSRGPTGRKIPSMPRTRKQSARSVLDSSDSQVSSRRESRVLSNAENRDERSFLVAPSPGVSKTLFEVSRRLEIMLPEETVQEITSVKNKERVRVSNGSVQSACSSRSSSPLVRQKATNSTLDLTSSQETDNPSEKIDRMHEVTEESVPKLESVMNGMIFKRRNKQRQERSQAEGACDLPNQDNRATAIHASVEMGERNLSINQASFKLPNSVLQIGNETICPRAKSMNDIWPDGEGNSGLEVKNTASVATSPISVSVTQFPYTMVSITEEGSSEKAIYDAAIKLKRQTDYRGLLPFANRRCKSADSSNKENMLVYEDTNSFRPLETGSTGKLPSAARIEDISNRAQKSIDLPEKTDDSPMSNRRTHCMMSRNSWASRLGQAHDSGVHSMSMSQNQEPCALDVPLGELSESAICRKESSICIMQSSVH